MKKHKIKCKFILSYENREDVILYCENVTDQFSGDVEDIDGQSGVETGEVSGKVFGPDELEDEGQADKKLLCLLCQQLLVLEDPLD